MKIEKHADESISKSKHSSHRFSSHIHLDTPLPPPPLRRHSIVSAVSKLDAFRIDDSGYTATAMDAMNANMKMQRRTETENKKNRLEMEIWDTEAGESHTYMHQRQLFSIRCVCVSL